jgi:hypothetical protein
LLDFCQPSQTKLRTKSKKHSYKNSNVHSAVSRGRLMQWAFGSVALPRLSYSFSEAVTTITV